MTTCFLYLCILSILKILIYRTDYTINSRIMKEVIFVEI